MMTLIDLYICGQPARPKPFAVSAEARRLNRVEAKGGVSMSAQPMEHHRPKHGFIPKTLDAVTASIDKHEIDPVRVAEFRRDFKDAWAAASAGDVHDIAPLIALVDKWWPTAASWEYDPEGARRVQAEAERLVREGPTDEQRAYWARHPGGMTRQDAITSWEQANGRPMARP
jgi:hypothetical protein